jgi:hypothetical protein
MKHLFELPSKRMVGRSVRSNRFRVARLLNGGTFLFHQGLRYRHFPGDQLFSPYIRKIRARNTWPMPLPKGYTARHDHR